MPAEATVEENLYIPLEQDFESVYVQNPAWEAYLEKMADNAAKTSSSIEKAVPEIAEGEIPEAGLPGEEAKQEQLDKLQRPPTKDEMLRELRQTQEALTSLQNKLEKQSARMD